MRRHPRRSFVVVIALMAMIATFAVVPATVAREPLPDGVARSLLDGSPVMKSRGAVDMSALPTVAAVPTVSRTDLDLPSPFGPTTKVRGSRTLAAGPSPVQATTTTAPPAAQPGWAGIAYGETLDQPADPWVAAGPDHIVQVVNTSVKIWDRTGSTKRPTTEVAVPGLFDLPARYENSDPRVIYDAQQGRWIMSELSWACDDDGNGAFGDPGGYLDLLVSRTADPTGLWDLYGLSFGAFLPDYSAIGTSTDKVAMTSNVFSLQPTEDCTVGAQYLGSDVTVADWADVISSGSGGDGAIATDGFSFADGPVGSEDYTAYFTPRVALQTPATSATLHVVVQHFDGLAFSPVYTKVTGSVAGTLAFPFSGDLNALGIVGENIDPPPPIQLGGTEVTNRIDSRPTDAIWQNNKLTWVATESCTPTADVTPRSCVRVTQLDTSGAAASPPTAVQDFLIGEAGAYQFFGGIGQALDGTLHVVWTRSADAPGGLPSSMTGYQLPADPDDSLSAPQVLAAGSGPAFTGARWGDYVGVAQDPQVPNAVWQGNMYSAGGLAWATRVSQLQTGGSTYVPIIPVRVLDSRTPLGVTGSFKANEPRDFNVAGVGSIPTSAIAVTGNVTVANQTAAGYVSVSPGKTANPRSSTINFPIGDVRANNVTVPLSSAGRLAAVYKAVPGKTANVIFDVTGYFLAGTEDAAYNTLAPTRFLDSRTGKDIGLTGRFRQGIPRKLEIVGGVLGVPPEAVAITANLTVVNQTKAGFVAITPTSQANPPTSTMNFPTGDVRANGLTAMLSEVGGDLWLVYKAGSGATTDLILDVTGFYLPAGNGLAFYPLEPGRVMDTRTSVLSGLTGKFVSGTPRRLDTDGHWGAPVGAKAVSGNLTVVGQNGAGYVAGTPAPESNPTTSTLNFPLGDVRANGITVPLNASGNQYFVYKAGSGRTTHLVLDVTGYFK